MVKFKIKKHELTPKPTTIFRSPGVYTTEVDINTIDLVVNPSFTNSIILGGSNITATTRPNTTYTENLEVMGEVRYPGAIRYIGGNLEIWDSNHWRTWDNDRDIFIPSPPRENKTNIFTSTCIRIYDYIIQRFSI